MVLKKSYIFAIVIAALVIVWVASGQIGDSGDTETADADSGTFSPTQLFQVEARTFLSKPKTMQVLVRGRTEAVRKVLVRAEADGVVVDTPFEKGAEVLEGDVLCELSLNARDARMEEAEALMRQRWLEFDASQKLAKKGHRSETQVASSRAAYDAARAQVKQREVELANTRVVAPFDGIYEDRLVEVGDYMRVGDPCAQLVQIDPFLVIGQVSETEVASFTAGAPGTARLITGETVEGKIRFVGKSADEATRTFLVELEVDNKDKTLRDGVTAEILVPSSNVKAHLIPTSVLVLNDEGVVGVRAVNKNSQVEFYPIRILEDGQDGVWVAGLKDQVTLIISGQDFVKSGQTVDVSFEPTAEAKL